jgi:hypothetical protein
MPSKSNLRAGENFLVLADESESVCLTDHARPKLPTATPTIEDPRRRSAIDTGRIETPPKTNT